MRKLSSSLSRNHYFVIGLALGLVLSCCIPQDIRQLVQQEECPQEVAENLLIERFGQDFEPHLNLISKPLSAKKPAFHFDRADVSSPGLHSFLLKASGEEREHAEKIMKYMNKRGGQIVLSAVPEPLPCFQDSLAALKHALQMELEVNQHLLDVHALASKENDPNLCDFIEANFLQEQVDGQKVLADLIRQLERAHDDLGDYLFDKYLINSGMHGGK